MLLSGRICRGITAFFIGERRGFDCHEKASESCIQSSSDSLVYLWTVFHTGTGGSGIHTKITGYDGSYVIIRVDVSQLIAGCGARMPCISSRETIRT